MVTDRQLEAGQGKPCTRCKDNDACWHSLMSYLIDEASRLILSLIRLCNRPQFDALLNSPPFILKLRQPPYESELES